MKKPTKRALLLSVCSLLLCVVMLVGTTFAWFTDTATTGVNKIQSGKLDIDIVDTNGKSLQGKTLGWKAADNRAQDEIFWEPGATYDLQSFKIVNNGNLALKYKVTINGVDGDSTLLKAIDFTVKMGDEKEGTPITEWTGILLSANSAKPDNAEANTDVGTTAAITISGHMKEEAGNEYQEKEITGLGITVVATQYTYESDSIDNNYDAGATFPTVVTNADELTAALGEANTVVLANDITLVSGVETAKNQKQTLDFNGHKLILGGEDQWAYGYLDVYGELTLMDSVGNGGIMGEFYHGPTKVPTAVFINDGAVVNLKSGTIENVYRGVANYYSGGTFNMTGGKIAVKQASEIESAGVLFRRGGTVNLTGGEISGAVYFEQTETSQPSYTIGTSFKNTNNSVFNTSGITATQNADGIWTATIN